MLRKVLNYHCKNCFADQNSIVTIITSLNVHTNFQMIHYVDFTQIIWGGKMYLNKWKVDTVYEETNSNLSNKIIWHDVRHIALSFKVWISCE